MLEEAGLLQEAIDSGAFDTSPKIKASKLSKAMKEVLTDVGSPKLTRVTVTRLVDED